MGARVGWFACLLMWRTAVQLRPNHATEASTQQALQLEQALHLEQALQLKQHPWPALHPPKPAPCTLSRQRRSGLCPIVRSSSALSIVLNSSPLTPVALNSSCLLKAILAIAECAIHWLSGVHSALQAGRSVRRPNRHA